MILNEIPTECITDFEKRIGQKLIVNERQITINTPARIPRYYALFENSEVMEGGMLCRTMGNGNTVHEAITDYCTRISNCQIVFGAYTPQRKEFQCPKLIYTKIPGK